MNRNVMDRNSMGVRTSASFGGRTLYWLADWNNVQLAIGLAIIVGLFLTPLFVTRVFWLNILILSVIYGVAAFAWNIIGGYCGQLLIGFVAFFGTGAYCTVMLLNHLNVTPWLGIPLSALPPMALGAVMSIVALRSGLKLDYFALFTIAIMTSMALVFSRWPLAGGALGMSVRWMGESFYRMAFRDRAAYLYIGTVLLLGGLLLTYFLSRSRIGKYLEAIREDESAAAALGINITKYKTLAMVISAGMAGVAGGFYAIFTAFIEPPVIFGLPFNVELLVAPIIGGKGTILGPIVGSFFNKPVAELVRSYSGVGRSGLSLIVYGVFLIVFILFMPEGIVGKLKRTFVRAKNRHQTHGEERR